MSDLLNLKLKVDRSVIGHFARLNLAFFLHELKENDEKDQCALGRQTSGIGGKPTGFAENHVRRGCDSVR